jgi:hypothetical protein
VTTGKRSAERNQSLLNVTRKQVLADDTDEPRPPYRSISQLTQSERATWEKRWQTRRVPTFGDSSRGRGAQERARWVLEFAFLDLNALSPGDWLNLRPELQRFTLPEGLRWVTPSTPSLVISRQNVREIQRWLRGGLLPLVLVGGHFWAFQPKLFFALVWYHGRIADFASFEAASLPDAFKARLVQVLLDPEVRVRACLECRRPFAPRKRQAYCGSRCSQTARTRKFRQAHPTYTSESQRRTYEQGQRKKFGNRVQIKRRGRDSKPAGSSPT